MFYARSQDYVVISRMEDIEALFTDHETFASTIVQDPVFPLVAKTQAVPAADDFDPVAVMSNRPEPDHGRIRKYTRQGFSNRRIKSLEPYIRRRSDELIDSMIATVPRPDRFDIHRADANRHISFGEGVHYCLGAKLAKFETQLVTETLARHLPALRLVDDRQFSYFPNITFRGPNELRVSWA